MHLGNATPCACIAEPLRPFSARRRAASLRGLSASKEWAGVSVFPKEATQAVRLVDVLLLGPFMVWAGINHPDELARLGLVVAGVATIAFNGANYLANDPSRLRSTPDERA